MLPSCSTMWPCVWMTVTFGELGLSSSPFLTSVESPDAHCGLPIEWSRPLLPLSAATVLIKSSLGFGNGTLGSFCCWVSFLEHILLTDTILTFLGIDGTVAL